MILIIDNYDSFTYNLYQYLSEIAGEEVRVVRNDKVTLEEIETLHPDRVVISPGPGRPEEAGISVDVIKRFAGKFPILGVCLGHQAIGYAFGAGIGRAKEIVHGKTQRIRLDGKGLFRNIPSPSRFMRYHSLVIHPSSLPDELEVTASSEDGEIMGVRHRRYPLEGVQFHPESIASEYGKKILKNFIRYRREPFNVSAVLSGIVDREDLVPETAYSLMEELTEGELSVGQVAAFLTGFAAKGVSPLELAAFAEVLGKKKLRFDVSRPVVDTCGTGGDGKGSFNISSMAAVVSCSCGALVVKHGNRGVSSPSGSADFYHALGVPVELSLEQARLLFERTGFVFLFAPLYHGSMKHAAQARKEIGIKTVMNLLGPLLNPADAEYQVLGVYSENLLRPVAEAMRLLKRKRAMIVCGLDGLDEISVAAPTRIVELKEGGALEEYIFDPEELGIKRYSEGELRGGNPGDNAATAHELFLKDGPEAVREAVLLNAGAANYTYGLCGSMREGYLMAKKALISGKTGYKLEEIVETGRRLLQGEAV
jgi:anthranilate synthase/phosphoribosyltransferase